MMIQIFTWNEIPSSKTQYIAIIALVMAEKAGRLSL